MTSIPTGELTGDTKYRASQATLDTFSTAAGDLATATGVLEAELTSAGFDRDPALADDLRTLSEVADDISSTVTHVRIALDKHQAGAEYHEAGQDADETAFRSDRSQRTTRPSLATASIQRRFVQLTDLIVRDTDMREVLSSGRVSDTPDQPVLLKARQDRAGFEVADGHHRVAEAIRRGARSVEADVDNMPDDEPLEPPFYDFSPHMCEEATAQRAWEPLPAECQGQGESDDLAVEALAKGLSPAADWLTSDETTLLLHAGDAFAEGDHATAADCLAQAHNAIAAHDDNDPKILDWVDRLFQHANGNRTNQDSVQYWLSNESGQYTREIKDPGETARLLAKQYRDQAEETERDRREREEARQTSTDPRNNGPKVARLLRDRAGTATLYRKVVDGPSGQRADHPVGEVRYSDGPYDLEIRTPGSGDVAGYADRDREHGGDWAVYSSYPTTLLGWADSPAMAADVALNGAYAATANHDHARTSRGKWTPHTPVPHPRPEPPAPRLCLTVISRGSKTAGGISAAPGQPGVFYAYGDDGMTIAAQVTDLGSNNFRVTQPGDEATGGTTVHGWQAVATRVYGADAEAQDIVTRVAGCEPRYRFSSALGHVAGFGGKPYDALVGLANGLKKHPDRAETTAQFHAANFSAGAVSRNLVMVTALLDTLDQVDHEAPAEQISALQRYRDALAEAMGKLSGRPVVSAAPRSRWDGDQPAYHGTSVVFEAGDLIQPGAGEANYHWSSPDHVYFVDEAHYGEAVQQAQRCARRKGGQPRVYLVQPLGEYERDLEYAVTGGSFRTPGSLRVAGEDDHWKTDSRWAGRLMARCFPIAACSSHPGLDPSRPRGPFRNYFAEQHEGVQVLTNTGRRRPGLLRRNDVLRVYCGGYRFLHARADSQAAASSRGHCRADRREEASLLWWQVRHVLSQPHATDIPAYPAGGPA